MCEVYTEQNQVGWKLYLKIIGSIFGFRQNILLNKACGSKSAVDMYQFI